MAHTFTNAEKANINQAITLLSVGNAPEIPYPSGVHTDVVELVGRASDSAGYLTLGKFKNEMANAPISTLLLFIKSVGITNSNLQHAIDLLILGQSEEIPLDATVNYSI